MGEDACSKEDPDFRFSQDTLDQLNAIHGVTPWTIRVCRRICAMLFARTASTPVGERKKELQRLLSSLEQLTDAMNQVSVDSYIDLLEVSKSSAESLSQKYKLNDILQMRREIVMLTDHVTQTLENLRPISGARPKDGRMLAFYVAHQFRVQSLPLSSYVGSPYMKVLELLFAEIRPEAKEYGYTRHGKWAIQEIESRNSE